MANTSQADLLKSWELFLAAAADNPTEPGLEGLQFQLQTTWEGARDLLAQKALLRSQLQQASRDLDQLLATGRDMFSRLSHVVKGRFGTRAEKLAQFGLQPLRPARKPKPKEKPPEEAQSATQTAAPATASTI